jgi:hypothetical protein
MAREAPSLRQFRIPTVLEHAQALKDWADDITDAVNATAGSESGVVADNKGRVRTIARTAGDAVVASTKTLTIALGAFTALDVGRRIKLIATSGGTNDLVLTIASVTSGTVIVVTEALGGNETFGSGVSYEILGGSRSSAAHASDAVVAATKTWTLTNGAFTASDVGRILEVKGTANSGANDGFYTIASVTSGTVVVTTEAPHANETIGAVGTRRILGAVQVIDPAFVLSNILVDGTTTFGLKDGTQIGQRIVIKCTRAAYTPAGTVLPISFADGTTLAFNAVQDQVELLWDGTNWNVLSATSVTVS